MKPSSNVATLIERYAAGQETLRVVGERG